MDPTVTPSTPAQPNALPTQTVPATTGAQPVQPAAVSRVRVGQIEKGTMSRKSSSRPFLILAVVVVIAGIATGGGLSKLRAKTGDSGIYEGQAIQKVASDVSSIQNGQVFGSANESDFKDSAEGYLQAGGLDGEGSFNLVRDGGPSQTVYMTSSVTDLSKFEGMRVKVWGETFKGQKAGWLMDVGRVKVIDTKATAPGS